MKDMSLNILGIQQCKDDPFYLSYYNDSVDVLLNPLAYVVSPLRGRDRFDRYHTAGILLGVKGSDGSRTEVGGEMYTGDVLDYWNRDPGNIYRQTRAQRALNKSVLYGTYSPANSPLILRIGRDAPYAANPQNYSHWFENFLEWIKKAARGLPQPSEPICGLFDYDGYDNPRTSISLRIDGGP